MKRKFGIGMAVLLSALLLAGCSVSKSIGYIYGGEDISSQTEAPSYREYEGENGIAVVYDENVWETPYMVQDGVVGVFAGNSISYTAVLLQTTNEYEDFLRQSAEELSAETPTVEYEWQPSIPDAEVKSALYDCGSYQTMLAEVTYANGTTVYVTAATHSGSTDQIDTLLGQVYPIGAQPQSVAELLE